MKKIFSVATVVAISMFGFVSASSIASADVAPAGCLANDFTTQLNKSTSVAYDQTNPNGATVITYSVGAGNPQNINNNGCNVDGVTVTLTTPDGVVHTIQTGGNYPVGTAVATLPTTVNYTANSADVSAGKLTASATATGNLHDTPGGTDPMSSGKTVSVTVLNPNTAVTITPSVATTSAGSSLNLTVTEHNIGTDPISNPSVTLTPPGTTLASTSGTFTGGDTGSDGILGVGETWTWVVPTIVSANTTYTAVGNGTDSLGNPVTSPNYPGEAASTTVHVLNNPTITTTLSASAVTVGTAVHDSATLSGETQSAGGTVTYTVYTNNTCTAGAQSAGVKTVAAGVVPDSNPITFTTAGSYYWQAAYSGDANNAAATSTCNSELLTVGKASPSISTTPSSGGPVGTVLNDSATLSGGSSPTGSVTFNLYAPSDATCSAAPVYTNTDTAAPYATTPGFTSNAAGTWHWTASYAGDANNTATSSPCAAEAVTTALSSTSIATTLSAGSVVVGGSVHDSATLSGETQSAGGSVTYTVYTDNACTLGAIDAGTKVVTNGNVPNSNNISFDTSGTYYWQAAYSGDANNAAATSTCGSEVVTIGKNAPTINTTLSATTAGTSTPVHDSATLTGASANAGGTATYTVYSDNACTLGATDAGTKAVTNGAIPDSNPLTFGTPGTYYWQVVYSGDANNAPATSTCSREALTITPPPPPSTGCGDDWKFVGGGWVNFGPIVYLNRGGRLLDPNNTCTPTLPLQFRSTNPASSSSQSAAPPGPDVQIPNISVPDIRIPNVNIPGRSR